MHLVDARTISQLAQSASCEPLEPERDFMCIVDTDKLRVTQLVVAAQAGDRNAFGELFERYERHVFAVALRRMGDYTEAQELVQEVFIQAMLKIDQLRTPEAFGGWLRQITTRMAINRAVRRGPDFPTAPENLDGACYEDESPLEGILEDERDQRLQAGLERLRDLDRETLMAFDAPVGTIKRRLHVARKRLAKEVEELVAV
jgi:RNA polymerase sigma-70 factor (ECF subfamily)